MADRDPFTPLERALMEAISHFHHIFLAAIGEVEITDRSCIDDAISQLKELDDALKRAVAKYKADNDKSEDTGGTDTTGTSEEVTGSTVTPHTPVEGNTVTGSQEPEVTVPVTS